jgi:hypothetical protein
MANQDKLDHHRCIDSEAQDPTSVTIEFLRARLLAERAVSKSARAKLDGLADKVCSFIICRDDPVKCSLVLCPVLISLGS